jgi:hypothetical protein
MISGINLKAIVNAASNQIFSNMQRRAAGYFGEAFKRTASS